jgi:predicted SAM-dependent methyltransferase
MKLKIGCLDQRLPGYVHVDIDKNTKPDIVADCCNMKMIKTSSVDEIVCINVIEHLPDHLKAMKEFHRVLKPNGRLKITIPHALNPNLHSPLDHYKGWTYTTPWLLWQDYHTNYPKFKCVERKLVLRSKSFQWLADRFPVKTEYLYWLLQPDHIETELEAIK